MGVTPTAAIVHRDLHAARQAWNDFLPLLKSASLTDVQVQSRIFSETSRHLGIPSLEFAAQQLLHWKQNGISSINVGGPMAGGKSTIAETLQQYLGEKWKLVDADDFHPDANIEKQRRGEPLTNEDRVPFLQGVRGHLDQAHTLSTCSALANNYRAFLAGQDLAVVTASISHDPWQIGKANYGLLQILVVKPYEVALEQLDAANTGRAPKRMFRGQEHFIQVTKKSEEEAALVGKPGILLNQYRLLGELDRINPWEAIIIEPELHKVSGRYDTAAMMKQVLDLPFKK